MALVTNAVRLLPTARAFPYLVWPVLSWVVIAVISLAVARRRMH